MKCSTHIWDFHAELTDGTIVRWCGQCGGLQTYSKGSPQNFGLGLDHVGFTKYAPTEIRLPENVKDDDGLYSEGIIDRDCQIELRSTNPFTWRTETLFKKPWTPDDDGEMVTRSEPKPADPAVLAEYWEEYADLRKLSGINADETCKGK